MEELLIKIKDFTEFLNSLDTMQVEARNNISHYDMMQQDLLHYLENNALKSYELVRLSNELKKVRKLRRDSKDTFEIITVFKQNILQLQNKNGREIILSSVRRKEKELKKYNNRVYSQEELNSVIKGEDRK